MLVVFGGFLAAGIPLVGAIVSIVGALGALFGFTYLLDIDTTVVNVVTAVGLGLSIDYGLLIVSRFREEYRTLPETGRGHGSIVSPAIVRTADSAGRTVAFSGVTFAIASDSACWSSSRGSCEAIGLGALVGDRHRDRIGAHPDARAALAHRRPAAAARARSPASRASARRSPASATSHPTRGSSRS